MSNCLKVICVLKMCKVVHSCVKTCKAFYSFGSLGKLRIVVSSVVEVCFFMFEILYDFVQFLFLKKHSLQLNGPMLVDTA